jgi:hypothetical protein
VGTAGFHKVDITPASGVPLAGFAARQGVSTGVHDRLFARALAIEQGARTAVFVSVDVLGLAADFVRRVRAAISERIDLPPDSVMITSTHTHSAPVTVSTFFKPGETPLMTDLAEADDLLRLVRERPRQKLQVAFNHRWLSSYRVPS